MNENIEGLLRDILDELKGLNKKLDKLTGDGLYGISDITTQISNLNTELCGKLDEVMGDDLDNSLADVCSKLDEIRGDGSNGSISEVYDILEDMKGVGDHGSLNDVCDKIDDLMGYGEENTVTDLYDKMEDVCQKVDDLMGDGLYKNTLADACEKLEAINKTTEDGIDSIKGGIAGSSLSDIVDKLEYLG